MHGVNLFHSLFIATQFKAHLQTWQLLHNPGDLTQNRTSLQLKTATLDCYSSFVHCTR